MGYSSHHEIPRHCSAAGSRASPLIRFMFPASGNGTTEFLARNAVRNWFCGRLPRGRLPVISFTGAPDSPNAAIRGQQSRKLKSGRISPSLRFVGQRICLFAIRQQSEPTLNQRGLFNFFHRSVEKLFAERAEHFLGCPDFNACELSLQGCITKRQKRAFVFVMAGIDCIWIPYGLLLGISTS